MQPSPDDQLPRCFYCFGPIHEPPDEKKVGGGVRLYHPPRRGFNGCAKLDVSLASRGDRKRPTPGQLELPST